MANNSSNGVNKATLTDGQVLALLNAAGLKPAQASPLAGLGGQAAALDSLKSGGIVDNTNRPAPAWREALAILCSPASEIELLWGGPGNINLSKVYAAAGQDKFVSFTAGSGTNNISAFLAFEDISGLILQKTAFTDIKDIAPLNLEAGTPVLPALCAALDTYREEQLKAALERRREIQVKAAAEDLNRVVQEAKTEADYNWYTPAALAALPPGTAITENVVTDGLNQLTKAGLVGRSGEFGDTLTAFAGRAFPLAGFVGVKVVTFAGKNQFALFRGLSTLLLVQLETQGGGTRAIISSIATAQLPELLMNMGLKQMEAAAPTPPAAPSPAAAPSAATVTCAKCGTVNNAAAKFCSKCGASLAPAPAGRFCTKCGAQASAGEKFCKKCGAPIK